MRFVALVSGGKDSIYSTLECIRNGHELVACVHLGAPEESSTEEESYMYQTAASEVVRTLVEDCLGVPLLLYQISGKSVNTSLVYQNNDDSQGDEVEDLYLALQQAKEQFNVQAVSSGAILSTYQRVRIEHVCNRLELTSLSYLWRLLPQKELLQKMLGEGIEAVVVRAACPPGLVPRKHLNKTLRSLWDTGLLERLHERYQFHVCGEGGEYESLVIDSPLHKKKLVFDEVVIDATEDGVGVLRIPKCHAEEKGEDDVPIFKQSVATENKTSAANQTETTPELQRVQMPKIVNLPHTRRGSGGLLHISEIMASKAASNTKGCQTEAELAEQEAREILFVLSKALHSHGAVAQDVLFVHLYLSEISHFASINAHYQEFFGSLLPPSRSCVAVGKGVIPGGRRVLLDCMIQVGSGEYMRSTTSSSSPYALSAHATKTSKLREVLHVQSISHWAPICVGPYSQVNTLRSGLHFLAGQIGLIPATMELHPTWTLQLDQCWKNVAAVLDALGGGSLKDLFSGLIYVSHKVYEEKESLATIEAISQTQLNSNGSIIPGKIDFLQKYSELYGGYEDEGTWQEMKGETEDAPHSSCPILVVSIPEMPKGAVVEVEVIALTETASSCLEMKDAGFSRACTTLVQGAPSCGWDTGHDFPSAVQTLNESIQIDAFARVVGRKCAATALITASTTQNAVDLQLDAVLSDMLVSAKKVLAEGRSGLCPSTAVHVRLFYNATAYSDTGQVTARDDGLQLRSSLNTAIAAWGNSSDATPASTVVPVHAMDIINSPTSVFKDANPFLAMQVLFMDPVHLETDIWIRKDREYAS